MQMSEGVSAALDKPNLRAGSGWAWAALLVALITSAGSLALTLREQKQACPLCFYQRAFALCLVAVLGHGLLSGGIAPGRLAALAFPLAIGGLGVAAFHVSLETRDILECPSGLFDVLTAPKQSLAMFVVLTIVLAGGVLSGMKALQVGFGGVVLSLALGGLLVWASISANPNLPKPPTEPYSTPLTVCRPPYHGPASK
jgi:disulfide bond formation protein DsbB